MKINIEIPKIVDCNLYRELAVLSDVIERSLSVQDNVCWYCKDDLSQNGLLAALLKLFHDSSSKNIDCHALDSIDGYYEFPLEASLANSAVKDIQERLFTDSLFLPRLRTPIGYLLDELVCNMQQHSGCQFGSIYAAINHDSGTLDIIVADKGITILGSYIKTGKYLEYIGDSDAEALGMAREGFSTKNRPDAENRGYGISSNAKMVVDGLSGEFVIMSGTAIYKYSKKSGHCIYDFSSFFEWCGTAVLIRMPLSLPSDFSFYDYIS